MKGIKLSDQNIDSEYSFNNASIVSPGAFVDAGAIIVRPGKCIHLPSVEICKM